MRLFSVFLLVLLMTNVLYAQGIWGSSNSVETESYQKSSDMFANKKMGVGLMFAGTMGYAGVQWQLNFSPDFGMTLGYGFSRGFNAFNLDFKSYLGSGSFTPFYGGGYANWSGQGDGAQRTSPQFLSSDFLDAKERETGEFREHLIYPSIGIQYNRLEGEWAGLSFLAQIIYLIDVEDFVAKPTAGLGSIYYF